MFTLQAQEQPLGHFFMGFLIGSALGALAGIFFAPKAGNKLRSDIRNKGNEIIKNSKDIYGDAGKKAKEIIKDAKQRAEALNKKPITSLDSHKKV